MSFFKFSLVHLVALFSLTYSALAQSAARQWNEQNLDAIRIDFPDPTVHARNLFHTSVAMWDAWAAYDAAATGYTHNELATAGDIELARHEAVSYAAYRVLSVRYMNSTNGATTQASLDALLATLGYEKTNTTTIGGSPAAVGNRAAQAILNFALSDESNELGGYQDPTYSAVNDPLILLNSGTVMSNPNRWQPLAFDVAFTQNGMIADDIQTYLGSHWGNVRPFALTRNSTNDIYHDPGAPPQLGGVGDGEYKTNNLTVVYYSSLLDPDAGTMIDISPGSLGNNTVGFNDGTGYALNPSTGIPYVSNVVNHADFGRVLAEFWADGPDSETPPGHWNTLANTVADDTNLVKRIGGVGPVVNDLEWDVKVYFALNAAMHDSAVAAWGCKRAYDYVRPISSIRYMGQLGQSSDPGGPSYHSFGIPLQTGLVEVITSASSAMGERHEHLASSVGKIALYCWPGEPADPVNQYSGAAWILSHDWLPYQRDTFVTPAFAGYISGHSTFSRAGAEVLTTITGDPFFPGGIGSFMAPQDTFLAFELGPSTNIVLQWATYYDAADQAGISRLYGGIHVPPDDGPGRIVGQQCGLNAYSLAEKYWAGVILDEPVTCAIQFTPDDHPSIAWNCNRGMYYKLQRTTDLSNPFTDLTSFFQAGDHVDEHIDNTIGTLNHYRIIQSLTP